MEEFDKILDRDEKVAWSGQPQFVPYFASVILLSIAGFAWLALLLYVAIAGGHSLFDAALGMLILPHFWVGALFAIGLPVYIVLSYDWIHYAITNRRVLLQRGMIGRDFEIVDFDQINRVDVDVGVMDKLLGRNSGSIKVFTPSSVIYTKNGPRPAPHTMANITDPYGVVKFLKGVSFDVKTDMEYPNARRPMTNPGYRTKYDPSARKP